MNKHAILTLNDFELAVHLGVSAEERAHKQTVLLNLTLHFGNTPKAVQTDNIADAMCYQQLTESINVKIGERAFYLVEHLAHEIYVIIREHAPKNTRINVGVTKFPKISGLRGGICFNYGDLLPETEKREESIS